MATRDNVPGNLHYSKDHEWVRFEGDVATVGITDHAQHALGDVTYVELPPASKKVEQFNEIAVVESAKAASDIFSPISGVVADVNKALEDNPGLINSDPYGEGWMFKLKSINDGDAANLLTPDQYRKLVEQEGK